MSILIPFREGKMPLRKLSFRFRSNFRPLKQSDGDRQIAHWEFRHQLLKRMRQGFDQAKPPESPERVGISVESSSSLRVTWSEPPAHNGAATTQYIVQWSCYSTFAPLAGEITVEQPRTPECRISGLTRGNAYYVRVAAENVKGRSDFKGSTPAYATPSNWRDVDKVGAVSRDEHADRLEQLLEKLQRLQASWIRSKGSFAKESPPNSRKHMKRSLKNLFAATPKFHKVLKRGVYLAVIAVHEDKVLVTTEDQPPVIEVDEAYPGPSLHQDFHWLMKLACSWEDIRLLRDEMEKVSTGATLFRCRLLQAIHSMQSALGFQDLGQFYFRPIKDASGSVILTTVVRPKDVKSISSAVKWLPIPKLLKRVQQDDSDRNSALDVLVNSLQELQEYHAKSTCPLPRGLYLGYLKLRSSVDLIRVLAPHTAPNMLPNVRVRGCPNVTREEWEWLKCQTSVEKSPEISKIQEEFRFKLLKASGKLLNMMGIGSDSLEHRIYDTEVLELSPEVTLLLLLPPADKVCTAPGTESESDQRGAEYIELPLQGFEIVHMQTYNERVVNLCSRLSTLMEAHTAVAQQLLREAFSCEESSAAKARLDQLAALQGTLENLWQHTRRVTSAVTWARDKAQAGLRLELVQTPATHNATGLGSPPVVRPTHHRLSPRPHKHVTPRPPENGGERRAGSPAPSVLRVFPAYDTGLAPGISLRLQVTPQTTAHTIVSLVVQEMWKTARAKAVTPPNFTDYGNLERNLEGFCLVVIVGQRERVLRSDFRPSLLQPPWSKGRLCVRRKENLLAAMEHGLEQATVV